MSSDNMKLIGVAAVLVLVTSVFALGFYSESLRNVQNSSPEGVGNAQGPYPNPVTGLGNVTTIAQARQMIGVNFSSPTFTPTATTFSQIRERNGIAALIYENPTLANLTTYSSGKIIILIMKDNTSFVDPRIYATVETRTTTIIQNGSTTTILGTDTPLAPTYQLVTISGHPGWAFNPTTLSNGIKEEGHLEWWVGPVHYVILAELPSNLLVQIANSMNT